MSEVLDVLERWDGIGVHVHYDRPSGTWIFVALHDATLGRTVGGCRMKVYERPVDGLVDATRLAAGMTAKWATVGLPFGGGKSVLAIPHPMKGEDRKGLLIRFAAVLNALEGAYRTGEDLGTTPDDMAVLASHTDHVMGGHGGAPVDPGPYTARGVFEGIRAALRARFGDDELSERTVLVQGVGDVGLPLARMVRDAGGAVLVADVDEARLAACAGDLGARVVDAADVYSTPCDVYAPCAVGATVNGDTVPRLRCAIVAGSANNQLQEPRDAAGLAERGILYAPDYVVNAGGALAFGLMHQGVFNEAELLTRVAGIGASLDEIFAEARAQGTTPSDAADARVYRILNEAAATA